MVIIALALLTVFVRFLGRNPSEPGSRKYEPSLRNNVEDMGTLQRSHSPPATQQKFPESQHGYSSPPVTNRVEQNRAERLPVSVNSTGFRELSLRLDSQGLISCLEFSHSGERLAVGIGAYQVTDQTNGYRRGVAKIVVFDSGSGEKVYSEEVDPDVVRVMAVDSTGRHVAVGCGDGTVSLCNVARATKYNLDFVPKAFVSALRFSADSGSLAVGDSGGNVRVWDIESKSLALSFHLEGGAVRYLGFGRLGDQDGVFVGLETKIEFVKTIGPATPVTFLSTYGGKTATDYSMSEDLTKALIQTNTSEVSTWTRSNGIEKTEAKPGRIFKTSLAPNGNRMVEAWSQFANPGIFLRFCESGKVVELKRQSFAAVNAIALSPDRRFAAFGDDEPTLHLIDLSQYEQTR